MRCGTASPFVMTLSSGKLHEKVAVLAGGEVVRVSDGKVLAMDVGKFHWGTPTFHDDVIYFHCADKADTGVAAVKLTLDSADKVSARQLWRAKYKANLYNAVVYSRGYVYAFADSPKGGGPVFIINARDGKIVKKFVPIVPRPGEVDSVPVYGNPSAAGGKIYLMDQKQARFAVLQAGPKGKLLGRTGPLGETTSSFFFQGDRLYVRTHDWIYCIGAR